MRGGGLSATQNAATVYLCVCVFAKCVLMFCLSNCRERERGKITGNKSSPLLRAASHRCHSNAVSVRVAAQASKQTITG